MFTMGFDGSSPCTSLSTSAQRSSVDLRSQRCDGTVGAATWLDVRALEVDLTGADAEFTTFQITVRDAVSGATLMTKEMVGTDGVLDLSTINAAAHPKLSVDVAASSVPGSPAWSDDNPPRIDLHWAGDPAALCVAATTAVDCTAAEPCRRHSGRSVGHQSGAGDGAKSPGPPLASATSHLSASPTRTPGRRTPTSS